MKSDSDATSASREESVFDGALTLPPEQRAAYLESACGADAALRGRVEALLRAYGQSSGFLEEPPRLAGPAGTILTPAPPTEGPGDLIGRYKIREKLGEGGCGVVYVAEQSEPVRRRVALKVIKLGMDTRSVIARFEAERQALAMMDHPNIAKVLDAGMTDKGRPYFVMELVRGIKITDYCDQNNLDTEERIRLFILVCHAVQHAHQKGIIHRDIKPSNILVTLHDGIPVPKVIDFGIAKATEGRLTNQTVYTQLYEFIGTPAYISPEQAEMSGLDIDTRSDIYSLGVLLYELLTGRTPFDSQELIKAGLDSMRRTIREKEPVAPSTCLSLMVDSDLTATARRRRSEPPRLLHFIRGDLDWIVMKSLEKDRTRRFETANALAADLQRLLKNEPVEARPPSNIYRLRKLIRRNRAMFAAIFGIVGALILGLAVSVNLYFKERQALKRTVQVEEEKRREVEARLALERKDLEYAKIGQKLWQAGVFMSQSQWSEAQDLMKSVPLIPQSAAIYNVLGVVYARNGDFDKAITNYINAATAQPTNELFFDGLLPLLACQRRFQEFSQWRRTALDRFATNGDAAVAERLALSCLIMPASDEETRRVITMLDTVAATPPRPAAELAGGLAEYRLGQFKRAVARLEPVTTGQPNENAQNQARLVLAMAKAKLAEPGHIETVNKNEISLTGRDWNEQMITAVLAREAENIAK
jgi:serine/threonine protein kinase/Flp pilus assembly protein TadD